MASLFIKDSEVNDLAIELAGQRGLSKTAAVKLALTHELGRNPAGAAPERSVDEILARFWRDHPLGEPTGLEADKAFYDSLSDQEDD